MNNKTILQTGKVFFALGVLAIGIVHLVNNNFPIGLLPVPATLPARMILIYLDSIALIVSGILILTGKYEYQGASLAAGTSLIWLLALHLPQLIMTYNKPDEWTPTFEVASFFAGSLILMGINRRNKLVVAGYYLFALGLVVFFLLHMIYAQYISTLITAWIPAKLFFSYLAGIAFLAVAISIFIRRMIRLSATLLGLMFLIWVLILHLPLVINNLHTEPEWTSLFVALAFSGISFMIAGTTDRT